MSDFPPHDFAARRARALDALGERGALVLPASPEIVIGRDTDLPYVPDPNLFYLTGCVVPEAVAVLAPDAPGGPFILFARQRDEERERWTGPREDPRQLGERLGADAAFPLRELGDRLPRLLAGADAVHFPLGWGRADIERIVLDLLANARRSRQRRGRGPQALVDPGAVLDPMRLLKDQAELARMREAARITVESFREAAADARPGGSERHVQSALEHGFLRRGASRPAFPTIVAAGDHATVLHYTANDAPLRAGDLLLIDAGASVDLYAADVSRTWSVDRTPTAPQHDAHAVVSRAHAAAIGAIRPGATEADVHRAALAELLDGMRQLGLVHEPVDAILAAEDERLRARTSESDPPNGAPPQRPPFTRFFPHRVSHWLGLEVHDVGDYAVDGRPRRLEPGMVLTVEPGLYVPSADGAPRDLHGIGIRIEDDVLVTHDGAEVLTGGLSTELRPD